MKTRTKAMLAVLLAAPALVAARTGARKGCDPAREVVGLSGDAAKKLEAAFEKGRRAGEPLHRKLHVSLEKLRWQVDDEADAKEIAATLEQVERAHRALREQREGVKDEINAMLDPAQRARLLLALGPIGMEPPPPPPGPSMRGPGLEGPCGRWPRHPGPGPVGPEEE